MDSSRENIHIINNNVNHKIEKSTFREKVKKNFCNFPLPLKFFLPIFILFVIVIIYNIYNNNNFYNISLNKGNFLTKKSDREIWVDLAYKIALPVLQNMSQGLLKKNMVVEYIPDYRVDKRVLFLESFGRLMNGISPWLNLPDDDSKEGQMRKKLRELAILSYKNAVDPNSPDMLLWEVNTTRQPLVDAAFLAQSFIRAPQLWDKLDSLTKKRYLECFTKIRNIEPYKSNWLLFSGIVECFFIMMGEKPNEEKMFNITNQINQWYIGDGWYSDGEYFTMNYYNSYVIHPMLIEMLEIMEKNNIKVPISSKIALERMQRFNIFMERIISPEGTFPAIGRSIVYRLGVFHTLALSAWKYGLPKPLTNGSVRSALTKVIQNMFNVNGNFNKGGYLSLGFAGHQPEVANGYTNNGSTYITSFIFLTLGLPSDHPFWIDPPQPWTSQKAWTGQAFPIDEHKKD